VEKLYGKRSKWKVMKDSDERLCCKKFLRVPMSTAITTEPRLSDRGQGTTQQSYKMYSN